MVQIQLSEKRVTAKIVFYGPGMSGKTTNLQVIHERAPDSSKGELTSISTDGDRTLFFDFMPLDLGTVAGLRTRFQLYTVPGQVYYNSTRKLVLRGTDGVVFVADSAADMLEANLESLANLRENLAEYGKDLDDLPLVLQFNKRDLPNAMPVEELGTALREALGGREVPGLESVANTGHGVFPTLKVLAALVLERVHQQTGAVPTHEGPAAPVPGPSMAPVVAMDLPGSAHSEEAPCEEPAPIPEASPKPASRALPSLTLPHTPTMASAIPALPQAEPAPCSESPSSASPSELTLRLGNPLVTVGDDQSQESGSPVTHAPLPAATPSRTVMPSAPLAPAFSKAPPSAAAPPSVAPASTAPRVSLPPMTSSVRPRSMAPATAAYVVTAFLTGIALGAFLAQPF
jgi:signal recognition particle receptor subunit beta